MEEGLVRTDETSLRDYLQILRRRRRIVCGTLLAALTIGAAFTLLSKPVYRATTRIMVEGKSPNGDHENSNDTLNQLFLPPVGHDIDTQIEVLQSASVLGDACKSIGLPSRLLLSSHPAVHVDVKQVGQTDVLDLSIESSQQRYVDRLAQALPATYLSYVTSNSQAAILNALDFARHRQEEEKAKLDQAERDLERFKAETQVANLDTDRNGRITEAIAAESKMRSAQEGVASAQARVDSLVAARKALPAFVVTPTTTSNIQQIEAMQERIAALRTERARLLYLYKPNHPEMQKLAGQIAELRRQLAGLPRTLTTISRSPNPAIAVYEDKITEARAILTAAQAELAGTRVHAATTAADLKKYSALERRQAEIQREIDQHESLFKELSKSVDDLGLRAKASHAAVQIITPAGPAEQVEPRPARNMLVAALLGLLLGCLVALLWEALDDRVYRPEDALHRVGAPALGYVPLARPEAACLTAANDDGPLLESYRLLRSNVQFAAVDKSVRSLLITSALPGEGKSVMATNLAIAMAQDGRKVILVDADLRLPTLHSIFNVPQQPGVMDVLMGERSLSETLRPTQIPGLRILTAGAPTSHPAEVIHSPAMQQLQAVLKQEADLVIFDSPACLAAADAQALSAEVDGVLFVTQLGRTKRFELDHAVALLQLAHARILGTVFNKLPDDSRDYHYAYSRYYRAGDHAQLPTTSPAEPPAGAGSGLAHRKDPPQAQPVSNPLCNDISGTFSIFAEERTETEHETTSKDPSTKLRMRIREWKAYISQSEMTFLTGDGEDSMPSGANGSKPHPSSPTPEERLAPPPLSGLLRTLERKGNEMMAEAVVTTSPLETPSSEGVADQETSSQELALTLKSRLQEWQAYTAKTSTQLPVIEIPSTPTDPPPSEEES